jgi:hypothetical protein
VTDRYHLFDTLRIMSGLVSSLGFDPVSDVSVFLFCAIVTFAMVTILWVVSEALGCVTNPCAVDLLSANLEPSIIGELRLESCGPRQASPESNQTTFHTTQTHREDR